MNTLKTEAKLAEKYKYKPLEKELSGKYREYFKENIPGFLKIDGSSDTLLSMAGTPVCNGYTRIVIGDYGAFIEFSEAEKASGFLCAEGQEFRMTDPKYKDNVKYEWYTADDSSGIKIYFQRKKVAYADYVPGMYYISVHECKTADLCSPKECEPPYGGKDDCEFNEKGNCTAGMNDTKQNPAVFEDIQIKNLKTDKITEPWETSVDRNTPFGNPFKMERESDRDRVCELYRRWFRANLEKLEPELQKIEDIYREHGKLTLFCWCAPKRCHAETIKKYIEYKVHGKKEQKKEVPFNEITGDVWDIYKGYDAVCITTNGVVKQGGDLVMGAGIAAEAKAKYPKLPFALGTLIKKNGNVVQKISNKEITIVAFPVKKHWKDMADIELIKSSAAQLVELADSSGWKKVLLPKPGCGNGKLEWEDVRKVLGVLDKRFYIIDREAVS